MQLGPQALGGSATITGTVNTNLIQVGGASISLGQTTMASSLPVTIASNQGAFTVNATLQTQSDATMIGGVNVKEINGVTPLMGNGTSGTGAQRVTLASDDTIYDSVLDTGNSTTSTLLGGGVFTGTGFDLTPYASWSVTIFSNVSSAASGLSVQWSEDNSNWDFTDVQTYTAGVGNTITFGRKARYVRLVYTNGASGQTSFRVQATAQKISVRQTRKFVGNAIVDQDTAQLVTAAMQGHSTAGGGAWVEVKVNPSGALTTASSTSDGAGTAITSNSTTTTATVGLDMNIRSILNTAPTTAGKLDVKGADGDVFVRQTTATNLKTAATLYNSSGTEIGTTTNPIAVQPPASGSLVVSQPTAGNLNATVVEATVDAAIVSQGTALGTIKNLMVAGSVTTAAPTYTTGQIDPLSLTTAGALRSDITTIAGTAPTTAGKLDIKSADGDVFVRSNAASTFPVNATQVTSPWIVAGGGTAGTAATGVVTVQGIASMTKLLVTPDALPANQSVNLAQVAGNTTLTGGANGLLAVGGSVATNVAITDNPVNLGAQAISAENTAVTATRKVQLVADLTGKLITSPHANKENFVSGIAAPTTATDTEVIAAPAAGLYIYVTSISVANTGSTTSLMTIETDTASAKTAMWYLIAPAGGGDNITFDPPLRTTATAKNVGVKTASASTTMYCSICGYLGT